MSIAGMSWEQVCRRAGGRRHYNSMRQFHATMRRHEVFAYWRASGGAWGWQAEAARALGVNRSTISRDMAAFYEKHIHIGE